MCFSSLDDSDRSKMGTICSTHGANFLFKNLKGSGHLEVGGFGGRVILK